MISNFSTPNNQDINKDDRLSSNTGAESMVETWGELSMQDIKVEAIKHDKPAKTNTRNSCNIKPKLPSYSYNGKDFMNTQEIMEVEHHVKKNRYIKTEITTSKRNRGS